jgi:mannose-6-phosphate isomerase-like protein (cupin superfamily)
MLGVKLKLEKKTTTNKNYRKVLVTTKQMQVVVMNIPVNEDIPLEVHPKTTQFIHIKSGSGLVQIDSKKYNVSKNDDIIIPSGTQHYVKNTGNTPLLLYTIYSPPEHEHKLIQKKKPITS